MKPYTFSNKTLNGKLVLLFCDVFTLDNWYEDRSKTIQKASQYPEERIMRERQNDISLINATGLPQPLKRIKRCHKHDTGHIILDDGYPSSITIKPKAAPKMVSRQNFDKISTQIPTQIMGPKAGFGSTIDHFGRDHDQKYFKTTNQAFYGEQAKKAPRDVVDKFEQRYNRQAGAPPKEVNSVKINAGLVGQKFKKDADIQENTQIQRAWMYHADCGVEAAKMGIGGSKIDIPKYDNMNSLPLSEGAHKQELVIHTNGAYRRIRSDISMENHPGLNFK